MWRLHRNLFFSTATVALLSVAVIAILMVAGNAVMDLFDLIDEGKITSDALWKLLQLLIPYTISFAMPAGTVVGVLVLMGRLSATSELTAMKASGISLWRVSVPVLLFCLLASGMTAWINAYAAPAARASYKDLIPNAIRAEPLRLIVAKQFVHDFPGYVVYVGDKTEEIIRDIWIWELDDEKRAVCLLRADTGDLRYDADTDALILKLERGLVELRDESDPNDLGAVQPNLFFEHLQIQLSLAEVFGRTQSNHKVGYLPLPQKIERLKQLSRRAERATPEEQRELRDEAIRVQFRIQEGFASALSAFSLGLLAIPLGLKASRKETSLNVAIAAGLTISYYILTEVVGWLDGTPHLRPDLFIWLPNVGLQVLALYLLFKANKH